MIYVCSTKDQVLQTYLQIRPLRVNRVTSTPKTTPDAYTNKNNSTSVKSIEGLTCLANYVRVNCLITN
jgi:hypothetical protein